MEEEQKLEKLPDDDDDDDRRYQDVHLGSHSTNLTKSSKLWTTSIKIKVIFAYPF